ncbi:MAG: hypothetical protein HQK51_03355 [Oligoflexia bacterium]|nr:hypothetical protein [Oligoflexia bacterium]
MKIFKIFWKIVCLINILFLSIISATTNNCAFAINICGRTAVINYQEVLIDTSTTKRGDGLRYYLEKDSVAKQYLDEYQQKNLPKWYNAAVGTVGTSVVLLSLGKLGPFEDVNDTTKKTWLYSGLSLLILNFLLVKTLEYSNERLLIRSVEEYNKRNLPQIYFSPYQNSSDNKSGRSGDTSYGISTGIIKEF